MMGGAAAAAVNAHVHRHSCLMMLLLHVVDLLPQALVVVQQVRKLLLELHVLVHEHRVHRGELPVEALQPRRLLALLLAAPVGTM
jgi:hypothetical protein